MRRLLSILALLLVAVLAAGCIWPISETTDQPESTVSDTPISAVAAATTFLSPLGASEITASGSPTATEITSAIPTHGESFSGRSIGFDLPEGYRVLEGLDGGCFLYHESLPGFLVLYPDVGKPGEVLTQLLHATTGIQYTEPPLEVDLGGLTFAGLFVETGAGSRLFLAAADGWVLVAQGPVEGWSTLAAGLNRVLTSLSFEEGF